MQIKVKPIAISIAIPLVLDLLIRWLTRNSMETYEQLNKPDMALPGYAFGAVWLVLFILMGISSYIIYVSTSEQRGKALRLYGINLFLVFLWPIIFFTYQLYSLAFIIEIILWGIAFTMVSMFTQISRLAGWILLPYFIWVTYAAYLNLQVLLLN
ncbi:TspO/MBR family protein [Anaerosporobacter sp.]